MSEFSDSYHLLTTQPEDAGDLLKRAELSGLILPQTKRWLTFLPATPVYLVPYAKVIEANTGLLIHYSFGGDHCCHVRFFSGPQEISEAMCDWENPGFDEAAVLREMGMELPQGVNPDGSLSRHFGIGFQRELLIEKGFLSEERAYQLEELCERPRYPTLENPYLIAKCLELSHYSWLSCADLNTRRMEELETTYPGSIRIG